MRKMTLALLVIVILIPVTAQETRINFYLDDGQKINYNLDDISSLQFGNSKEGRKIVLFLKDSLILTYPVYEIDSISFSNDMDLVRKLVIYRKGSNELIDIQKIDSINFSFTETAIVEVDTSELGTKELVLLSAHKDSAKIEDDKFKTEVSSSGTQLLIVIDTSLELRGFTLSAIRDHKPSILKVDALSTAYSILFMTPGILTTDPVETEQVLYNFENLITMKSLVEYLKENLHIRSLTQILREENFNNLVYDCINEYLTKFSQTKEDINNNNILNDESQFIIDQEQIGNNWKIKFKNYQWRYVNLYRRDMDIRGNEKKVTNSYDGMSGAVTLSWGSILSLSAGSPNEIYDDSYTLGNEIFKSEYWIIGPGFDYSNNVTPPSSVDSYYLDAYAYSMINYLALPLVDLFVGAMPGEKNTEKLVKFIWSSIKTENYLNSIYKQQLDVRSLSKEIINISMEMLKDALTYDVFVNAKVLSKVGASALKGILFVPGFSISSANATIFINRLFEYPETTKNIDIINKNYVPPTPIISSIVPDASKVFGEIIIKGTNFGDEQGKGFISFGGFKTTKPAKSWKDNEIILVVPDGALSTNLIITSSQLKESEPFDFHVIPTIYQVYPDELFVGSEVGLRGSGFGINDKIGKVNLNDAEIKTDTWVDNDIKFTLPETCVSGKISVTVEKYKSDDVDIVIKPIIESVNPVNAIVGQEIIIAGKAFGIAQGNSTVVIGGKPSKINSWNFSQIKAIIPDGITKFNVYVLINNFKSNEVTFNSLPNITGISPSSGRYEDLVTINGSGFGNDRGSSFVAFGAINASDYSSWSDNQIKVKIPYNSGNCKLYAIVNDQKSNEIDFTVIPRILSVNPSSAQVGTEITITGSGFGTIRNSSKVRINSLEVSDYTSWSNTQIKVKVPSGATSGKMIITVSGNVSNEYDFTVSSTQSYSEVTIGTQVWMLKNLDVVTYRNGDTIPQVTSSTQWENLTSGAWCYFDNDQSNGTTYGKLYNWYAVNDPRGLAPSGWHIPSDDEWKILEIFLGMSANVANETGWRGNDEGGKLKESGTNHWRSPNSGATNSSGFTGLPADHRFQDGSFPTNSGIYTTWWTSSEVNSSIAWVRSLFYNYSTIFRPNNWGKGNGLSVRCVKD